MKKAITILTLIIAIASCKKEVSDEFHAYTGQQLNDTVWVTTGAYSAICDTISNTLNTIPFYVDSFSCSSGTVMKLKGNGDVVVSIPPICGATGLGNPSSVKIAVGVLSKKGDFIRALSHTKNIDKPLEASCCFYVKSMNTYGHEIFMPQGVNYSIAWTDAAATNKMSFYEGIGVRNNDTLINWLPSINGRINQTFQAGSSTSVKGYEISSNVTRWIGGLRYIDTTAGTSSVNISFSALNFTNKNTIAYTVLKDTKTVIRMTADNVNKIFYCNKVPKGANATIVTISLIDNQFYLGIKEVTTGSVNYFKITPDKKTLNDIQSYLDNL